MSGHTTLALGMQRQLQQFWCWAACSSSTSVFFDDASTWTQCRLANEELGQQTCCDGGDSKACNQPWYVDKALSRTGNLAARRVGRAAWQELCDEIDAKRPVCARIEWSGGGGHFVLITGYDNDRGDRLLEIEDPWTGNAWTGFDEFADAYQVTGSWTHTYLTRAA